MIFGKTRLELKVGIFVLCGLIILFIFILSIGSFKTWSGGYRVNFIFTFVNGVKKGAPVRLSGVDVGEVKSVKLISPVNGQKMKIQVTSWVGSSVKIPVDSTIWVNTLGLLGEKYIEIMPGVKFDDTLKPDQALAGQDPMPMHEVTKLAKSIGVNLDEITGKAKSGEGTIGKFLNDDRIYNNLEALTEDLKKNPWKLLYREGSK